MKDSSKKQETLTPRVQDIVGQQFEVWIICTRGTGHQWRKMATCEDRRQAEQLVAYHKMIDEKFPRGHYSYRIQRCAMPEATNSQLIDAMNLLCEHVEGRLPDNYEIRLSMRRDEASVELIYFGGDDINIELNSQFGISCINEAIREANEHASKVSD